MNKAWALIITAVALFVFPVSVFAKKSVFVVESYNAEFPWDASYKKALEDSLGVDYALEFFEMDTKRVPKDQHQKMADMAWGKYLSLKPDLVILGDDAALKYLAPRFSETKTPIVYLGINNNPRAYLPKTATNFTGVLERPLLKRSVVFIKSLIPAAKKILILFDANVTSEIVKKEVFEDKDSIEIGELLIDLKMLGELKSWQETVASTKGEYDAIVVGLYQAVVDAEGKPVNAEELITWVSQNSPVPLFAFWDFAVGATKTIGGQVIYGKDMGILASGLVKNILEEGKSPKDLRPIFNDQGLFLFSKAQLAKWKLTLPANISSSATLTD